MIFTHQLPTLGIDPGQSGAVCFHGNGIFRIWRDLKNLRDIAQAVSGAVSLGPHRAVIEFVSAMPGQGVCSMFSFGRSTGTAFGAFFALTLGEPIYEVAPQRWQAWYRTHFFDLPTGAGSFDSCAVAPRVLTPEMLDQCRKKRGSLDHNACDAALITIWAANQSEEALRDRVSEHFVAPQLPRSRRK